MLAQSAQIRLAEACLCIYFTRCWEGRYAYLCGRSRTAQRVDNKRWNYLWWCLNYPVYVCSLYASGLFGILFLFQNDCFFVFFSGGRRGERELAYRVVGAGSCDPGHSPDSYVKVVIQSKRIIERQSRTSTGISPGHPHVYSCTRDGVNMYLYWMFVLIRER